MGKYDVRKAFFGKHNGGIRKLAGIGSHMAMDAARAYMGGSGAYNVRRAFFGKNNGGVRKLAGIGSHLALEAARKRMSGSGAYRRSSVGKRSHTSAPHAKYTASHMCVHHREFVANIYSGNSNGAGGTNIAPSVFSTANASVNPGLPNSAGGYFNWLSGIANNYSKYRFKSLAFYYKALTSETVTNTNGTAQSLGEVCMAAQYDEAGGPNPAAYTSLTQMLNSEGAVSTKPSTNLMFGIECKASDNPYKWYFVRGGPPPAQSDFRLYDLCSLQIATQGIPIVNGTAAQIGQLWVEYEVDFETAVDNPNAPVASAVYVGTDSNVSGAQSFFTGATAVTDSIGLTLVDPTETVGGIVQVLWPLNAIGRYHCEYDFGSNSVPSAELFVASLQAVAGTTFPGKFLTTTTASTAPQLRVPAGETGDYSKSGHIAFILDLGAGNQTTQQGFSFAYTGSQLPQGATAMFWNLRVMGIPSVSV